MDLRTPSGVWRDTGGSAGSRRSEISANLEYSSARGMISRQRGRRGRDSRVNKSKELLVTCDAGWKSAVVSVRLERGRDNQGRTTRPHGERRVRGLKRSSQVTAERRRKSSKTGAGREQKSRETKLSSVGKQRELGIWDTVRAAEGRRAVHDSGSWETESGRTRK